MYLLNICESSGVLRTFYILKICLSLVTTILPIIVMFIVDCFTCIKGMDLSKQYGKPKKK